MKAPSHSHSRVALPELADRLRRKSRKLTAARVAVLSVLRDNPHPMSIKEIFAAAGSSGCDLATVYRCLHLLEGMGMVKRFDLGDGLARFELLSEGDDGHHHHLVCTACAGVVEIEECFPHHLEEKIAVQNGFKSVTHKLEFFGICPRCQ